MRCFQIIKTVLDNIYADIPGAAVPVRDNKIKEAQKYLRSRYARLSTDAHCIDYADPVNRFAYVYSYVTCHANLVASKITATHALRNLFDNPKVSISCIGGGPGSDFLGVVKFMMQTNKGAAVKCYLLDREERWGDSWSNVDDKIDPAFRISTIFQRMDVTETDSPNRIRSYVQQSDLITLTYFMSEVFKQQSASNPFFDKLVEHAKPGTLFLYIDNDSSVFSERFDDLIWV